MKPRLPHMIAAAALLAGLAFAALQYLGVIP
jgi:hypothetical protein